MISEINGSGRSFSSLASVGIIRYNLEIFCRGRTASRGEVEGKEVSAHKSQPALMKGSTANEEQGNILIHKEGKKKIRMYTCGYDIV